LSALTLKLIQIGFLVLLWVMVLSVAVVMRGDLYARRRTRAPKPAKAGKASKVAHPVPVATPAATGAVGAGAAAAAAAAAASKPAKPVKPPKPKRGAARTLLVTGGAKEGTSIELGANPITVGRLPENTLVLEDDYVSGRHARLYPHEGAWVVEDLGSTNGTYLDRTRLTSPMVLPVGTPVRIGKTVVELRK
jgi:FHA domain